LRRNAAMSFVNDRVAPNQDGGAERRQLTILFCDLVGSTELSSAMDPEDLYELMLAYQRYCARCIEDAGGFVARFAGDGVLAYFGYPLALEDAPQRAVHAALRLREAGANLPKPGGRPLAVRTGIATGLVVVGALIGKGSSEERAVAGDAPNLAARLQASAAPNAVIVSETTKLLAEGVFEFRAMDPVRHKGLSSAISAWEVLGQSPTVSRFVGRRGIGVSPLISRTVELDELLRLWLEVRSGRRRLVGIVGDPGIGKSRLLEEARKRICLDASVIWLEGGGASIYDNTPFHVVSQFVARLAAIALGATGDGRSREARPCGDQDADRVMGLVANLMGDPARASASVSQEQAARSRAELMDLLKTWVRAAALRGPIVLAVEDLHWADPSTLEFLDLIVGDETEQPLLVIYTSRENFTGRWPSDARHRVIALESLDDNASAALARAAAGDQVSLAQCDAIVSQAAGVPLYVEELARLIANQGAAGSEHRIPPTLADLLAVRLEELGPAKHFAQVAAVLGQEFPADLFAAMVEQDDVDSTAALAELQAFSIIMPGKNDARGSFKFRHALIAAAAYDALLRRRRRELHARAANIVVERYPALAEAQPQILARHWTQAGDDEKAVKAWEKAGDAANARSAFREAEHAYREALSVLDLAVAMPDHDRIELRMRASITRVLQVTQGYSSVEAARMSKRVSELAAKVGNLEALSREESAKWRSVFTAGDYAQAEEIAARVMSLTAAHGDALWRRTFHLRAGIQQGFYTGDLARGERDFLAWSAIQDGSHRGSGDDVLSMGIAGLIAHMTGRQAVAEERIAAAFAIADRRSNPYDLAMALHTEACFHHFSRDAEREAESARRLEVVARNSGFEYAGYLARGWLAIANAHAGDLSKALEQVNELISGFDRLEARVAMVFWLSVSGQIHYLGGNHAAALRAYSEAIAFNPQEKAFGAEAYLGRARVLKALGRRAEAESDLRDGIRLTAAIGATSFQLRFLIEFARLQLFAGSRADLERILLSVQALMHSGYCAADLADVVALSDETATIL
jgi:predicted ATPase